jgi:hypothetical protein
MESPSWEFHILEKMCISLCLPACEKQARCLLYSLKICDSTSYNRHPATGRWGVDLEHGTRGYLQCFSLPFSGGDFNPLEFIGSAVGLEI